MTWRPQLPAPGIVTVRETNAPTSTVFLPPPSSASPTIPRPYSDGFVPLRPTGAFTPNTVTIVVTQPRAAVEHAGIPFKFSAATDPWFQRRKDQEDLTKKNLGARRKRRLLNRKSK